MALQRLLPFIVLLSSCAGPSAQLALRTELPTSVSEARTEKPHKVIPVWPERSPPPSITTPRKGDPAGEALKAARLVQSSCEEASADEVQSRIIDMRAAVD